MAAAPLLMWLDLHLSVADAEPMTLAAAKRFHYRFLVETLAPPEAR